MVQLVCKSVKLVKLLWEDVVSSVDGRENKDFSGRELFLNVKAVLQKIQHQMMLTLPWTVLSIPKDSMSVWQNAPMVVKFWVAEN